MDQRVALGLATALTLFAASWLILYVTDRERLRASALLARDRAGTIRASYGPPALLVVVGARSPVLLARAAALSGLRFPQFLPAAAKTEWETARTGLTALLLLAFLILALWFGELWPLLLLLTAPLLASVLVRRTLRNYENQRLMRIDREFLAALDIVVLAMEAGLPFEGATGAYVKGRSTELSEELGTTARELEVGYRRREALQRLVDRTGSQRLSAFASSVRVAEEFGSPLAGQLRSLSRELRAERKQRLQEMALKAPITMLLPTAGFILPPIFAIVIGPLAIRLATGTLF